MLKPWQFEGAICSQIDTEFYFPERNKISEENKKVKAMCNGCAWKKECLTYALHYTVVGIWGGTSARERQKMRKKLNIIPIPITERRF
ncbi:MAG: WhiB family transcriptional regulator [Micrococcales bacterium]|nr:WhiB family transcriptional regulator [Micrococcales bacterium]